MNPILVILLAVVLFFIFNFLVGIFGFQVVVIALLSLILAGMILGH